MAVKINGFNQMLASGTAFYRHPDYLETTQKEMSSKVASKTALYTHNTEPKVWRVVKNIFSKLFLPTVIQKSIHTLVARKGVLPSSSLKNKRFGDRLRKDLDLNDEWKFKRISVKVDGHVIDAAIMGKASTFENGRWMLYSNGNGGFYEEKLKDKQFKQILTELNGNALVFNYPGVGSSQGMPNRQVMVKAYKAMLTLLEDEKKGIGAKEIIGYGHSIGGGVQGHALKTHKLKSNIKYVFVKGRTFSNLSAAVSRYKNKFLGFLLKPIDWNLSSVGSSKKLKAPEIIMQTANVEKYTDIGNDHKSIIDDDIIGKKASLARKLLKDKKCPKANKYFLGIPDRHDDPLSDIPHLVKKIGEMLNPLPIVASTL